MSWLLRKLPLGTVCFSFFAIAGFTVTLCCASIIPALAAPSRADQSLTIDVPLKCDGFYLGDVRLAVGPDGRMSLETSSFAAALRKAVKAEVVDGLLATHSSTGRVVESQQNALTVAVKKQSGVVQTRLSGSVNTETSPGNPDAGKWSGGDRSEAANGKNGRNEHSWHGAAKDSVAQAQAATGNAGGGPGTATRAVHNKSRASDATTAFEKTGGPLPDKPREAERPSYLPLEAAREKGIDVRYDTEAGDLVLKPRLEQRPETTFSFAAARLTGDASDRQKPARLSGYLNASAAAGAISRTGGEKHLKPAGFEFDAAMRSGSFVIESEAALGPSANHNFSDAYFDTYVFQRRGTRLVYDFTQEAVRFKAGDVATGATGFQASVDLLGLSLRKSYAALRPNEITRPTASRSFTLEKSADVEVFTQGVSVRRFRLLPGHYNIKDLPLGTGANDIKLVIDDGGDKKILAFTLFSNSELLAPGLSEWSFDTGIKRSRGFLHGSAGGEGRQPTFYAERSYLWDAPAASASYRQGLTESLTAEVYTQADGHTVMGGGEILKQSSLGFIAVQSAISAGEFGGGIAGAVSLDVGQALLPSNSSLRFAVDYESPGFMALEEDYTFWREAGGLTLAAYYSTPLSENLSASLSSSFFVHGDGPGRWDAGVTLMQRLHHNASVSVSAGYTGQSTRDGHDAQISCPCGGVAGDGLRASIRLSYSPDTRSHLALAHDLAANSSRASYGVSHGDGVGSWSAQAEVHKAGDDESLVTGSLGYTGNRAEMSVSHAAGVALWHPSSGKVKPEITEQVTTARLQTAVAFADGKLALGRPVHGGFAILDSHESLKGHDTVTGGPASPHASSGRFGPALVSGIQPYAPSRLVYDLPGAPEGHSESSGAIEFFAPYKAGYRVTAGSHYSVTVMGMAVDDDGQPVSLLAGTATEQGREQGRKVEFFTNRTGRFAIAGAAPGQWLLEFLAGDQPLRATLTIPAGSQGIHQAGTIKAVP